ncbi:MAG: NUDIX domain-containing protein [Candidatus Omnitrophica bacterium]|nr:NUDIX domain-containing protein [Candidatus Omnitrophota bacterium]
MSSRKLVSLILLYDTSGRILLQHRTPDARIMPNHWAFFGGEVHEGETPGQAVRREAFEELEVTLDEPRLMGTSEFTENGTSGTLYIYVQEYSRDKSLLRLKEGQGWGWYLREQTQDLLMVDRDRTIIERVSNYLESPGV